MKAKSQIVNLRNSIIDFLLNKLEKNKALPNNSHIDFPLYLMKIEKKHFENFQKEMKDYITC